MPTPTGPQPKYGIYSDLIGATPPAPVAPPAKPGFFQGVKNFFFPPAPTPVPTPAPVAPSKPPSTNTIYSDLLPNAPKQDVSSSIYGDLIPKKQAEGAFSIPDVPAALPNVQSVPGVPKQEEPRLPGLYQTPERTPFQKFTDVLAKPFVRSPEDEQARSVVINNITKVTGQPYGEVEKHLDQYTKELGVRSIPNTEEIIAGVSALPITAGIISNPVTTILGIAGFEAMTRVERALNGDEEISKTIGRKFNLNDTAQSVLDVLELVAKGEALHGLYKTAPGVAEKFIKETTVKYNLPKTVYVDPVKIRSIFQTGEKISAQELDLVKSLGLTGEQYRDAVKNGVSIQVPTEKVTTIVDKPYWAKVKETFGFEPSEPKVTAQPVLNEKVSTGPRALLPEGQTAIPEGAIVPPSQPPEIPPVALPENKFSDLVPQQIPQNDKGEIVYSGTTEMGKAQLEKNGFGVEAVGFGNDAEVKFINGKPAVAFNFDDNGLSGFSVQKDFRGQGLGTRVLKEIIESDFFGRTSLNVVDPNEAMLGMMKKVGTVTGPDGSGVATVTLPETPKIPAAPATGVPTQLPANPTKLSVPRVESVKSEVQKPAFTGTTQPLTLAPSQAKTPEEIKAEAIQVHGPASNKFGSVPKSLKLNAKEPAYQRPLIGKTELKKFFETVPGFKEDPILTVDKDKNLTYSDRKTRFSIKASALGLNPDNLKQGDKITVDEASLKAKGAEQQLRVSQNGKTVADVGSFKDGTPIKLGHMDKIRPIDLPEMVDIARSLMGQVPKIRQKVSRMMGGAARGVFQSGGRGEIRLRADLFDPANNSIEQVAKTLAHEIGHLTDYLPEETLKRGNLLGRLFSLRKFLASTFNTETDAALDLKKMRNDATMEILKEYRVTFEEYITSSEVREQLKDEIDALYQQRIHETGAIKDKTIKKELTAVSEYWRPYDKKNATPQFLAYRNSGKELYADAISMLYNSPGLLQEMAPTFYREFFDALDRKPAVRDAYFEVQSLLSGDKQSLIDARRKGVQQMFKEGDYKSIELQNERIAEKEQAKKGYIANFKFNLIDKNYPMLDRISAIEKAGTYINPDDNPTYYLEERNYLGGKVKGLLSGYIEPSYKALQEAGVDWNTFGENLFYERIIAGDRSIQANPRGITPKVAEELNADLINSLTPEQQRVLKESVRKFREFIGKIADEAYEEGLYTPELYAKMKENPAYATFQVLDYIEEGMSSKVYKSIGTFKDVANVADSSILKVIATVRAIERNKVARVSIDFLKEHYPEEVQDAKKVFSGRGMRIIDAKAKENLSTILVMREGKANGYYVDPYIAHSINNDSIGQNNALVKLLTPLAAANRGIFRPVFIGFNLGFQGFNAVRDFTRFWKNIPGISFVGAMKRYVQGARLSKIRAFGAGENPSFADKQTLEILRNLEETQVFSTSFSKLIAGEPSDEKQIGHILQQSGLGSFKGEPTRAVFKPIVKVMEFIQNLGEMIETMPKAAGYYELSDGKPLTREQRSYIRKYLGSPDFLAGGYLKKATNELYLFSNAITQGIRSDYQIATEPETRSGYWWKTAKINLIPKILMLGASLGLFGVGIKKMMDDASEYDKTNYTVVPLGSEGTKTIYLRIPQDEAGRLVGGLFWKGLGLLNPENKKAIGKDLADVISFMGGQVPNISPAISTTGDIYDFLQGKNPYDDFRNRNVLTDQEYQAGGSIAAKQMAKYVFEQLGGGIFYRFQIGGPDEKGPVEKTFSLPVVSNILGRFIRVSDFGQTERLKTIKQEVQSKDATRQINDTEAVDKQVSAAIDAGAKDPKEYKKYEAQVLKDVFGTSVIPPKDLERANKLLAKFRLGVVRGGSDPAVGELISSTSNEQKVSILLDLRERMTPEEYKKFVLAAVKDKVISVAVTNEVTLRANKKK